LIPFERYISWTNTKRYDFIVCKIWFKPVHRYDFSCNQFTVLVASPAIRVATRGCWRINTCVSCV
jgi:hypothetical protein